MCTHGWREEYNTDGTYAYIMLQWYNSKHGYSLDPFTA